MLIDCNTYIGHWPFRQLRHNTCASRLEQMEALGVDLAVLSNLNGIFYKDTQAANQELYEAIRAEKRFVDRFIPFAVINPVFAGWKDDIETSIGKLGMKGIRLYPKYHRYELDHPACIELVKIARDKNLPVALSLRMVDSRPSSWLDIQKEWALKDVLPIIKAVPDAKFLILNVANNTSLQGQEMEVFQKANLVMDTSGRNIIQLGDMLKSFGKEKFAFGSHAPLLDHYTGLIRVESLMEKEADKATKDLLRSGNIRRLLDL
jgi:predicted TIM-barrel fold metal-dependent hydrolase